MEGHLIAGGLLLFLHKVENKFRKEKTLETLDGMPTTTNYPFSRPRHLALRYRFVELYIILSPHFVHKRLRR